MMKNYINKLLNGLLYCSIGFVSGFGVGVIVLF